MNKKLVWKNSLKKIHAKNRSVEKKWIIWRILHLSGKKMQQAPQAQHMQ